MTLQDLANDPLYNTVRYQGKRELIPRKAKRTADKLVKCERIKGLVFISRFKMCGKVTGVSAWRTERPLSSWGKWGKCQCFSLFLLYSGASTKIREVDKEGKGYYY